MGCHSAPMPRMRRAAGDPHRSVPCAAMLPAAVSPRAGCVMAMPTAWTVPMSRAVVRPWGWVGQGLLGAVCPAGGGAPGFLWVQKQALPKATCQAAGGGCTLLGAMPVLVGQGWGWDGAPAQPWPCLQHLRSAARPSFPAGVGSVWPWRCAVMATVTARTARMRRAVLCPGRCSAARARWRVPAAGSVCRRPGAATAPPTAGTAQMSR